MTIPRNGKSPFPNSLKQNKEIFCEAVTKPKLYKYCKCYTVLIYKYRKNLCTESFVKSL